MLELDERELDILARAAGLIAVTEIDDVTQIVKTPLEKITVLGLEIPGRILFTGRVADARAWLLARLEAM
jgi:hypothetical protein